MRTGEEVQPLRVAARPGRAASDADIAEAVRRAVTDVEELSASVMIVPLGGEGASARDLVVEVSVDEPVGSPDYASLAWELTHRLQDTGVFERVEADVPVAAFHPEPARARSFEDEDCGSRAGAEARDWALRALRWHEAMDLLPAEARGGAGIRIGHPDSGFVDHFALGDDVVDRACDWDVISDDDDATDPLRPPKRRYWNVLPSPGHGTSTASVILGRGDGSGFSGAAPRATLVPFRACESVLQLFDSDVAKAVRRARAAGCHIVSMSLGGTGFFGLRDAIQEAVDDGMIVMAAAGNRLKVVTAPAYYDNCLAVAAVGPDDARWEGSSRGKAVDVAAPGNCVWAALFDWKQKPPGRKLGHTNGTSYAVAHLAGVAALWLARWGHQTICDHVGRNRVQAAFLHLLRTDGVCRRPAGWDDRWGIGCLDAAALLAQPLPDPADLERVGMVAAGAPDDPVARLAALADVDEAAVRRWLDDRLGRGPGFAERVARYEGELTYLLMSDEDFLASLTEPGRARRRVDTAPPGASGELRALLAPRG